MSRRPIGASFRDPSGFVFKQDGLIHRQINASYLPHYRQLMESGLYQSLVDKGFLVAHEEAPAADGELVVILPEQIPLISYPYEWSFSQLQDAARLTLAVQRAALEKGMTLKDASAYNVQFVRGRPILIDTLSFEPYEEGQPWVAYRQFCQHFLAPLALMAKVDIRLGSMSRVHLDGIPLDLAAEILPGRSSLRPSLYMHIRLHSRFQRRYQGKGKEAKAKRREVSRRSLDALIESLDSAVAKLSWKAKGTEWGEYYEGDSYTDDSTVHKEELVAAFAKQVGPETVWDLGANTGVFSRIAAKAAGANLAIAFDIDPAAVEHNYRQVKENGETEILPLLIDLTNPSPSIGWNHGERDSLVARGPVDLVMGLALVHHLAISNNVPLSLIASFLAELAPHAIVEFVPKSDPKVETLLETRRDVFPDYTNEGFEAAFASRWRVTASEAIKGSDRTLYLLARN
jgi:ribosomal protein L11 methylase PrmA